MRETNQIILWKDAMKVPTGFDLHWFTPDSDVPHGSNNWWPRRWWQRYLQCSFHIPFLFHFWVTPRTIHSSPWVTWDGEFGSLTVNKTTALEPGVMIIKTLHSTCPCLCTASHKTSDKTAVGAQWLMLAQKLCPDPKQPQSLLRDTKISNSLHSPC